MIGVIDWVARRSRMIVVFIVLSLIAGLISYVTLPKEDSPDIQIPILIVSLPFQGISAVDSERLLVKTMEDELANLDGLQKLESIAAQGYAAVILEFDFGWDKTKILADVRSRMKDAESRFPAGADKYSIKEINTSEIPIAVVSLSGSLPERILLRAAKDMEDHLGQLKSVLEISVVGIRNEIVEVTIDPLRLESYDVTAGELINAVKRNNLLVAAGDFEPKTGSFAIKIPSSLSDLGDIYALPIKTNGDRVVTIGDVSDIRLTFEDRAGTGGRTNGAPNIALQIVKRKGFSIISTVEDIKKTLVEVQADWPKIQNQSIVVELAMDQSTAVNSMIKQLESSVLTAVTLVMIVVIATLGTRAALLTGFSIPTAFLLAFTIMGVQGITISNMVMFGLILAVGMMVDGAIVIVEYADRCIKDGIGPMRAYVAAAKRMFWPIISSTATTLCAFLPMLFWPGVTGQFMRMLPITLIFVLSSSLLVALIYLPVIGGLAGRISGVLEGISKKLRASQSFSTQLTLFAISLLMTLIALKFVLRSIVYVSRSFAPGVAEIGPMIFAFALLIILFMTNSVLLGSIKPLPKEKGEELKGERTLFGRFIAFIVYNPIMAIVAVVGVVFLVGSVFYYYGKNNNGVDFFVETEPENAIVYIRARGNFSLEEKDDLLKAAEEIVRADPGVKRVFAFAGAGGLNLNLSGGSSPSDTIAQLQIKLEEWEDRPIVSEVWFSVFGLFDVYRKIADPALGGNTTISRIREGLSQLPGVKIEILGANEGGPESGKPISLSVTGDDPQLLLETITKINAKYREHPALINIEDSRPLPGIDWHISVEVEKAGRYGADVQTVGAMIQLITHGILLDKMRIDKVDDEVDVRVRFPEEDRVLSTLDTLKMRTQKGLVPLANFITRVPKPKLDVIERVNQKRFYDIKAGIDPEAINPETQKPYNATELVNDLIFWLSEPGVVPEGVLVEKTGDQENQEESEAFLFKAFTGALGLMFVILLAQFNSFYNSALVLLAVVLSTAGVLIGMLVMNQPFSIIMTGTGIVALAGIVVNNNILLIDTYQRYVREMPPLEAIVKTAEQRIRPVLLTTFTTMAGLFPMMIGLSLNFFDGGASIDSPTALWWKQLATAVVFGLGFATLLTLVFTPSMLAIRIWLTTYLARLKLVELIKQAPIKQAPSVQASATERLKGEKRRATKAGKGTKGRQ